MRIVIFVDYSNSEFNKDFQVSNRLIADGHNVFLAVNEIQFQGLKEKCDRAFLGYSKPSCELIQVPKISEFID